ncbi:hypothetical protein D3C84_1035970 [compost metagenome]
MMYADKIRTNIRYNESGMCPLLLIFSEQMDILDFNNNHRELIAYEFEIHKLKGISVCCRYIHIHVSIE